VRAVIFDLWDTLVEWPVDEAERLREQVVAQSGIGAEELGRRWRASYRASQTGPLSDFYLTVGVAREQVGAQVAAHHEFTRRVLRPRPGATAALAELRRRGLKLAVLSNCSEDVPAAWPDTELAGLFDAETFSAQCGQAKPEPEIYLRTAAALGLEPADCYFVGDGANDELRGAADVGMTPVLFAPGGVTPGWPEVAGWTGLRVALVEDVLELEFA
jgi:putative hydrolase of the HAD superfamily